MRGGKPRVCLAATEFVDTALSNSELPPVPSPTSFSSELISARNELGLTQSQLSTKSGLSLSAIKAYEAGRNLPGARELRELCQALQVSPNKLLFGTELPFRERSFADVLAGNAEQEPEKLSVTRAATLMKFLASDERTAVLTLVRSLAIARHGEAKIKEALVATDLMTGLIQEFGVLTKEGLTKNGEMDAEASAVRLEAFMDRHGHNPAQEKLLKK